MAFILGDAQHVTITLAGFTDAAGLPVTFDQGGGVMGPLPAAGAMPAPTWASSDTTGIVTVTAAADGMSAVVQATGTGVLAGIQVSCTSTPPGAAGPIVSTGTVDVTGGVPAAESLVFGTAEAN
jgi:hypothetical protein